MKKYLQLYEKIKDDIKSGVYKSNTKLPSKRIMADLSGVSLTTVEMAYGMLSEEGYLYSVEKKGYFVSNISEIGSFTPFVSNAKINLLPLPKSDFKQTDFEYSIWFKTIRKVLNDNGNLLFKKSPPKGCEVLRNAISEYLLRYRKMLVQPANIVIGSGAEQLYALAILLLGKDKKYGIENPCYSKIPAVYKGMGAVTVPLKMGKDGILSGELNRKNFDILHVTPFNSFPSGITTSLTKRLKYLSRMSGGENYIIEDDYASEFFLKGHPIETLYSLSENDSVLYINTFSKSLSDSMRIGYMLIPDRLSEKYDRMTANASCTVPVLDQYILADFISSGNFERHLARKRRQMFRR
ncbi:MAG TPA: PLP-dependent aminotransferase family protein [Ruminococcaceae bacterium]|nr:PLP-dependent aminotransferase family protein [Oscillospiraceae bacterium]